MLAYRTLSTGLVKGNNYSTSNSKEILIIESAKKAASLIADITEDIPVYGSIVKGIDSVIDKVYEQVN